MARWLPRDRVVRLRLLPLAALALSAAACRDDAPRTFAPALGSAAGAERIHIPSKLTSIESGQTDALGQPVRIACATCHTLKETATLPESPGDLKEFHVGLAFDHGSNRCASCHVSEPRAEPKLRLADGTHVPMTEAMALCAQCHGPQYRDYQAGAHGGMSGAWDLSRGDRVRNHCVDCHDPHVPAYPSFKPTTRMRDRLPVAGDEHP